MSNYQWLKQGTKEWTSAWTEVIKQLKLRFPDEWQALLYKAEYMGEGFQDDHVFYIRDCVDRNNDSVETVLINVPVISDAEDCPF